MNVNEVLVAARAKQVVMNDSGRCTYRGRRDVTDIVNACWYLFTTTEENGVVYIVPSTQGGDR